MSLSNLGRAHLAQDAFDQADPLLTQAVEMYQRLYRGDHARLAAAMKSLGVARLELGKPADAEKLFRESLDMWQRLYPQDHAFVSATKYPPLGERSVGAHRAAALAGFPDQRPYLKEAN